MGIWKLPGGQPFWHAVEPAKLTESTHCVHDLAPAAAEMVPATQYEQPWREEVTAPAGHSAMHCVEPGKETCPEGHCVQAPPTPPGLKKPARHGEHGNPGAEEDCPGPQATQLSPETLEKPTGHDSHDAWP